MADGAVADSLKLLKIVDELHSYCRHTFQLWVQWFTFFLTVNYAALGWFASAIGEKKMNNPLPLELVGGLFTSQNVLGIVLSAIARRFFVRNGLVLGGLYGTLGVTPPEFAHRFYAVSVLLGAFAMVFVAVCWILFVALFRPVVVPDVI